MSTKTTAVLVVLLLATCSPAGYRLICDETFSTQFMDLCSELDIWEVCPTGVLNLTGTEPIQQRICLGGQLVVNGGTVNCADRFNHDQGAIVMNGGSMRINGDYKFPDTGGPCRLYLNNGVFSVNNCENFVDRDSLIVVGYGVMRLDSISGIGRNPNDWLSQGGIVPADGFGPIIIRSVGGQTEIAATIIPKITFESESSGDLESASPAVITVNVVDAQSTTYTVNYSVVGGTADGGGVDYTLAAGTLTFNSGQTTKQISIPINNDGLDEEDETIIVGLSDPGGGGAVLGPIKQHTYTIVDPRPTVQFASAASTAMEDESPHELEVVLSAGLQSSSSVSYSVGGGTADGAGDDYTLAAGSLTFNAGETSKTISISIVDDDIKELPETIIVSLSNPTPESSMRLGTIFEHTVTLRDPWATVAYEMFKLDLACPGNAATLKNGWIAFEGVSWCDGSPHDGRGISDIGGTGIDAYVDNVYGKGTVNLQAAAGDPIANTAFQDVSGAQGDPGGSLYIRLSNLAPGEYWLYTYHNWGGLENIESINAAGNGVYQVEPVLDVPIQSVSVDSMLVPSLVKFYTDGSGPVTVTYVADLNSRAVFNSFELHTTEQPSQASNPSPDDGASGVSPDVILSWAAGADARSHDVYFGTDPLAVADATTGSSQYQGNQAATTFDPPGLLDFGQTYHWRIDEILDTTTSKGQVWKFHVDDGKAKDPRPTDGGRLRAGDSLRWTSAAMATSHDIYFGTDPVAVANATTVSSQYQGNQTMTSYDPGVLTEGDFYYWRIDERGSDTFVPGDVWSFQATGPILLQVDLALPISEGSTEPWPGTAKPGWYPFVASRWSDMYAHDCVWEKDSKDPDGIAGSGVHAMLSCGYEGMGGLHAKDLCRDNLGGGGSPTGSVQGDPIANTWYYAVDWAGLQAGDNVLILTDLPAGVYELVSYHNWWEPGSYLGDQGGRNCLRCVQNGRPPLPSVTANPLPITGKPPGKDRYRGLCLTGSGTGVTAIKNEYDVPPSATLSDSEVTTSLIKFYTDGSEVLVIYEAPDWGYADCARPGREGGRGILNAFELIQVPSDPCYFDTTGTVDNQNLAVFIQEWLQPGGSDFSGDGIINMVDYAMLAAAWMQSCL